MTLPAIEHETAANPRCSVIWLHGLGADGNDFFPIVAQLADPAWPPMRFVFPHAPVRPVTINNGLSMRAWYDIAAFDLNARQDVAGMRASVGEVETLIAREHQRGVPSGRIFLAGFSQGGAIALTAGLRHAEKLAGIIALSTYLPLHVAAPEERSAANATTPVFWGHGSADPVVMIQRGFDSRDVLLSLGYPVEWHTYLMAHSVCAEEIADLRRWIGQRIA
ncbi:MAG: alpha/beta hydrolase [Rhodanobacter sp.]